MRYLRFILLAICATLLESTFICAQESDDYYKFDDQGILVEFLHTTPDGVKISYAYHNYASDYSRDCKGLITYPDGTQIDYSKSISEYGGYHPIILSNYGHNEDSYVGGDLEYYYYIKNWYKGIRSLTSFPTWAAMRDGMFDGMYGLRDYLITFPDNSQIRIQYGGDGRGGVEHTVYAFSDVSENGDYFMMDRSNYDAAINLSNLKLLDPETNEVIKIAKLAVGKGDHYDRIIDGKVFFQDGSTFIGEFDFILDKDWYETSKQPKSPYLQSSRNSIGGINLIVGISIKDGNIVNKENEIVAIYRDSKQLDEIDMASELAAMQGRIEREKAAAKKEASERAAITAKYGQKYANAFFAGEVVVGMPWSLVQIGLKAHSFKEFHQVALSVEHQNGRETTQIYTLISSGFARVGSMWVSNGTVQSITYY